MTELWPWRVGYNLLAEERGRSRHQLNVLSLKLFRYSSSSREEYSLTCVPDVQESVVRPPSRCSTLSWPLFLMETDSWNLYHSFLEFTPSSRPHPPVVGKVTHHSIELYWDLEKKVKRQGPQEQWFRFSIEEEYPKMHTYSIIYT